MIPPPTCPSFIAFCFLFMKGTACVMFMRSFIDFCNAFAKMACLLTKTAIVLVTFVPMENAWMCSHPRWIYNGSWNICVALLDEKFLLQLGSILDGGL